MNWFYNLKIGTKLLSAIVIVALIGGVIGYMGILKLRAIEEADASIMQYNLKPMIDLAKLGEDFQKQRVDIRQVFLAAEVTEIQAARTRIKEFDQSMEQCLQKLAKSTRREDVIREIDSLRQSLGKFEPIREKIIQLVIDGKKDDGLAMMKGDVVAVMGAIQKSLEKISDVKISRALQDSDDNAAQINSTIRFMQILTVFSLFLSLVLGVFISRVISRPIKHLTEAADKLALGDVDVVIDADTKDEVGKLAASFKNMIVNIQDASTVLANVAEGDLTVKVNVRSDKDRLMQALSAMVSRLTDIVCDIQAVSGQVATGSQEMSASSEMLSHGATEQSSSVEEVSSSMEEMAANIKQNADNAQQTEKIALKAAEDAKEGGKAVLETVSAMKEIAGKDLDHRGDRPSDESAGVERRHRSRKGGRARQGFRRGGLRSPQAGGTIPDGRGRNQYPFRLQRADRAAGRRDAGTHRSGYPENGGLGPGDQCGQQRTEFGGRADQ